MHAPRVAMLVYPGAGSFDYVTVNEIFGADHAARFGSWYRTGTYAEQPGPVRLDSSVVVDATYGFDQAVEADLVVVPGWIGEDQMPPEPLLATLCRAHDRGARIMSICTGAFILGYAGLLDHRRATTHWSTASLLASLFPAAKVDPRALFVDDDRVLTAAGMSAGMDLALYIVRGDFGADVAAAMARYLVLAGYRAGGQSQFVDFPLDPDPSDPLPALLDHLRRHLDRSWPLRTLADQVHLSPRSFTRHFYRLTGTSPHAWLLRERLQAAQRLLEATNDPIDRVAVRTGMGSATNLRAAFQRHLGLSPNRYRATHRARSTRTT